MGSQFDEIAKAVARGVPRRRALIGGVAGAVVASLLSSGKAPSAEAGVPETTSPAVQQKPAWNQQGRGLNQTRTGFNQARFNQARFNQRHFNQARFNQWRAKFNQRHFNQGRPIRQGASVNQHRSHGNQPWLPANLRGSGPSLNMVRGPRFDPTKRP